MYHFRYRTWLPYIAFGLGVVHGNANITVPTSVVNTPGGPTGVITTESVATSQSNTDVGFDLGAGVKKRLTENVQFRGDFRFFDTSSDMPNFWRIYAGLTFTLGAKGERAVGPTAGGATASTARTYAKTIPGATETVTATVESIDRTNRTVTLKNQDGDYNVLVVPASFTRFDSLNVGDQITTRYYENIVLRKKPAGEPDVDQVSGGVTRSNPTATGTSGRTAAHQRTITATVTAIDLNVPSITLSGPNGWNYSSRVKDKDALKDVEVGDKVDITWTEAVILSLDQAK
jgi:hypothetical protein